MVFYGSFLVALMPISPFVFSLLLRRAYDRFDFSGRETTGMT
jgi:hypothetical protein